eukprot:CAMPEP_0170416370 /NCGR_PEP_ID=MMETSP0117_2-20130122/33122_1 /TAXON_ID=400756 /ORGANISM="Durinskia baltica, Strain CSIRO CS-38" /LENGTH=89 /DNA_ID=CAMNT_0010674435 /DNA_START=104 /DNA_END=369 /DNA_ORIENTATION=-
MALAERNALQGFIYGTALLETICFSIGSAYFVTGSYPDGALVAGDNDYWNDFKPPEEEFEAHNPFFSASEGGAAGLRAAVHGGMVGTSA